MFYSVLQANTKKYVFKLGHDLFPPLPFQCIIQKSSCHSTLNLIESQGTKAYSFGLLRRLYSQRTGAGFPSFSAVNICPNMDERSLVPRTVYLVMDQRATCVSSALSMCERQTCTVTLRVTVLHSHVHK